MGVTLSAAGSLQWYRDTLAPGESFDALVAEAGSAGRAARALMFLPYLSGRAHALPGSAGARRVRRADRPAPARPHHARRARGRGLQHEGLHRRSFAEAGLASVSRCGCRRRSEERLWRKILASVLGVELVTVNSTEGAAYGAALLAGVGAGAWTDVAAACEAAIAVTGRDAPDAWRRAYEALYPRYRALYPALKP